MMEKVNNLLKNGGEVRLPPGFRFHPTDEELVVQYLRRKVFSSPLPAAIIPEVDLSNSDPWDLPGDLEQERYFFSTKEAKYPNGNRSNRATNSGYWKATGLDKQILTSKGPNHHVVGMKKTLVFYRGKPPHGSRTDWIMHEYRLHTQPFPSSPSPSPSQKQKERRVENWVLCRIFLKRRGGARNCVEEASAAAAAAETLRPSIDNKARNSEPKVVVFYDFLAHSKDNTPAAAAAAAASSSSDTSGITELSTTNEIEIQWNTINNNNNNEHEDTTSSPNTFPSFTREP